VKAMLAAALMLLAGGARAAVSTTALAEPESLYEQLGITVTFCEIRKESKRVWVEYDLSRAVDRAAGELVTVLWYAPDGTQCVSEPYIPSYQGPGRGKAYRTWRPVWKGPGNKDVGTTCAGSWRAEVVLLYDMNEPGDPKELVLAEVSVNVK